MTTVTSDADAELRSAVPGDYDAIAAVVDAWWGRPVQSALPRLFLDHFHDSSLVAASPAGLRGFLIGFMSPSSPDSAYIHFAGVAPAERGAGLGRRMYEHFFAGARSCGRTRVTAITSPGNTESVAFHRAMGFAVRGPLVNYDGPGTDRIVFERPLRDVSFDETGATECGLVLRASVRG